MAKIGILLTNTGTPTAPTPAAVRVYLREFLSDRRVVRLPRLLWYPILYGLILPRRSKSSAALYQRIWTNEGSPMRVLMHELADHLTKHLNQSAENQFSVAVGMNYGQPSISEAYQQLHATHPDRIIVLPLYPQYSHTTTASSLDRFSKASRQSTKNPENKIISSYANQEKYIAMLAKSVQHHWQTKAAQQHLLISFHGVPEYFIKSGDPYQQQCEQTAQLLVNKLNLKSQDWTLCYQSRFGYTKWLGPATQDILTHYPRLGIKQLDVICPGFSIDCLETLEEIAIRGQETFQMAGGENLNYIPALNASSAQVEILTDLIQSACP